MFGLTNTVVTNPVYGEYDVHVQYSGTIEARATASVSFPSSSNTFRYVILQQKFPATEHICLMEVKVFLRGTYNSFMWCNALGFLSFTELCIFPCLLLVSTLTK